MPEGMKDKDIESATFVLGSRFFSDLKEIKATRVETHQYKTIHEGEGYRISKIRIGLARVCLGAPALLQLVANVERNKSNNDLECGNRRGAAWDPQCLKLDEIKAANVGAHQHTNIYKGDGCKTSKIRVVPRVCLGALVHCLEHPVRRRTQSQHDSYWHARVSPPVAREKLSEIRATHLGSTPQNVPIRDLLDDAQQAQHDEVVSRLGHIGDGCDTHTTEDLSPASV